MAEFFRLFVASPGDVKSERKAMSRVVDEINVAHGPALGYRVELVRWETHAAPSAGRPQGVINEQIGAYDLFAGIMWRRFGTPTGVAGSGTEEEFRIGYQAWEKDNSMPLMFYFCQKPFMPKAVDELEQMKQVLTFRKELESKALAWEYASPTSFADAIRKHLCLRLSRLVEDRKKPRAHRAQPNEQSIKDLQILWDRMTPGLQAAFSVAYNENRQAGDPGIQTRDLFSAMLRVAGNELAPIVTEIPAAALPESVKGPIVEKAYVVEERPWLSHCIASSVSRLQRALPAGRALTATDVFVDIAKHGTGESVRQLRLHNIGPNEIDQILATKSIDSLRAEAALGGGPEDGFG